MTYLQDILATNYSALQGYRYRVLNEGRIVFGNSMTGNTVTVIGVVVDPEMTVESMPERFRLAAMYWVMHRYYVSTGDGQKANYYHDLYSQEWSKVRHNRLRSGYVNMGTDL
ncbi:MAG TPA: hypothetical protein PL124_11155 [Candidatus Cloacimonadota bacterium]|nr:hypothetical protein [Candidatus Cloacimonadota bacterium]